MREYEMALAGSQATTTGLYRDRSGDGYLERKLFLSKESRNSREERGQPCGAWVESAEARNLEFSCDKKNLVLNLATNLHPSSCNRTDGEPEGRMQTLCATYLLSQHRCVSSKHLFRCDVSF